MEHWILMGGILHFGLLAAGALGPTQLDFAHELNKVHPLLRQLPDTLADGSPLARAVCGFIAVFWATRLAVQWFVFDARPWLTTRWLRLGYHALTVIFAYQSVIYGLAAASGLPSIG
jgi:hypothetical protein